MSSDPYAVLGLRPPATEDEVRTAYRLRSQLLHPDLHAGASEQVRLEAERAMAQLTDAYRAITLAGIGSDAPARAAGRVVGRLRAVARPAYRLGRVVGRRRPE